MNFEELLKSQGFTDEQIAKITAGMSENSIFLTSDDNLSERFAKMKEQRDEARTQLKEKEETITALETKITEQEQAITENQEALASIDELKAQLEAANNEKATISKTVKLEKALEKAGVTDMDYIKYKLGGVDTLEVDDKGEFTSLDNTLKDLKESLPSYFQSENPEPPAPEGGFKVIDNQLKNGKETDSNPFDDIMAKYK